MNAVLVAVLLLALRINAATYYVSSSSGSDAFTNAEAANNEAKPWSSLTRVQSFLNSGVANGDVILFKAGDWFGGALDIKVGGITFGAYGTGDKPSISGYSAPITGWTQDSGNIWRVPYSMDKSLGAQLFVNRQRYIEARWPNLGSYNTFTSGSQNGFGDSSLSGYGANYFNGCKAHMRTIWWAWETKTVTGFSNNWVSLDSNLEYQTQAGWGYYFAGCQKSFLDSPGEWYYDGANLYVWLEGNQNPNSNTVQISITDIGFLFQGSWGANNIAVNDLRFEGFKTNAISMTNSNSITFSRCHFRNVYFRGILLVTSSSITIQDSVFEDMAGQVINDWKSSNTIVRRNRMERNSMIPGYGLSGTVGMTSCHLNSGPNLLVEKNIVKKCGFIAFHPNVNGGIIQKNYISEATSGCNDGGAIYTWGTDSVGLITQDNIIVNTVGYSGATDNIDHQWGSAIYYDDNSSNGIIRRNTLLYAGHSGVYIHNSKNARIEENTVFSMGLGGVTLSEDTLAGDVRLTGVNVLNNKLVQSEPTLPPAYIQGIRSPWVSNMNNYGTFSSNAYIQPYSDLLVRKTDTQNTIELYDTLVRSSFDSGAKTSPVSYTPYYKVDSYTSANMIGNSDFGTGTSGWSTWCNGNSCGTSLDTNALGSNALRFWITGSSFSLAYWGNFAISSGSSYLIRFTAITTQASGYVKVILQRNTGDYSQFPAYSQSFLVRQGQSTTHWMFFDSVNNENTLRVNFELNSQYLNEIIIDNVEMFKVTYSPSVIGSYKPSVIINPSDNPKTAHLPSANSYVDTSGSPLANTVVVPAWGSIVVLPETINDASCPSTCNTYGVCNQGICMCTDVDTFESCPIWGTSSPPASSPPASPSPPPGNCYISVYEEGQTSAFNYWTFGGSSMTIASSTYSYSGSYSAELYFPSSGGSWGSDPTSTLNTAPYEYLSFQIRAASGSHGLFSVFLRDLSDNYGPFLSLTSYLPRPVDTIWQEVRVPIASLLPNGQAIDIWSIGIGNGATNADPNRKIYIDSLRLYKFGCLGTPTNNTCTPSTCASLGDGTWDNGCGQNIVCCTPPTDCAQIQSNAGSSAAACGPHSICNTFFDCGNCLVSGQSCIGAGGFCAVEGSVECAQVILILAGDSTSFSESSFKQSIANILAVSPDAVSVISYTSAQGGTGVHFKLCGNTVDLANALVTQLLSTPPAALQAEGIFLVSPNNPGNTIDGDTISPDLIYIHGGPLTFTLKDPIPSGGIFSVLIYYNGVLYSNRPASFVSSNSAQFILPPIPVGVYEAELLENTTNVSQRLTFSVYDCTSSDCTVCSAQPLCKWCDGGCTQLADSTCAVMECPEKESSSTATTIVSSFFLALALMTVLKL